MLVACALIATIDLERPLRVEERHHDAIHNAYAALGYSAVQFTPDARGNDVVIEVLIAGQWLRLLVDTGSDVSVLDESVAKRLKLRMVDDGRTAASAGGDVKFRTAFVRGGTISNGSQLPCVEWTVMDLAHIRKFNKEKGQLAQDGIFGLDLITHLSAVIDVTKGRMLVRDTYLMEEGLQGEWLAEATPGGPVRFRLDKLDASVEVGGVATRYRARIDNEDSDRELRLLADPAPDVFRRCRYAFRGDKLVIAGPLLPGDDVKAVPEAVAPPKPGKPKYSVLTFTRAPKPPAGKPAP